MTLILYLKCQDAQLIIADRKQTNSSSTSEISKKYYLPKNKEFLLALSGDVDRIFTIINELKSDQTINSDNARIKISQIMQNSPTFGGEIKVSSGLLMIKENTKYQFHQVHLSNSMQTIIDDAPKFKSYGDGIEIANHLIRKFKPYELEWKIALEYGLSILNEVSKSIESVGNIEDYGVDVILISNNEQIQHCTIEHSSEIQDIELNFDPVPKNFECIEAVSNPLDNISENIQISEPEFQALSQPSSDVTEEGVFTTKFDNYSFDLPYSITKGKIRNIVPDSDSKSLIISVHTVGDGQLSIDIPRKLLDSKNGTEDDDFFVLIDGQEEDFDEKIFPDKRILSIKFLEGSEEIEIIGTNFPLFVRTNKKSFEYGDKILISIHTRELSQNSIHLKIIDENNNTIYSNVIPLSEKSNGVYQEIVRIEGNYWKENTNYIIKATLNDQEYLVQFHTTKFVMALILDQKVYSWGDKVRIALIAPELNRNPEKINSIGNSDNYKISVQTKLGKLNYSLQENKKNSGIFFGEVTLTGFKISKKHKISGREITSGHGPADGLLACKNDDAITIVFSTQSKTITASALIRWNIGEIQWLESAYLPEHYGIVRVVDPDMNINPEQIDSFKIKVWSDTDPIGIIVPVNETDNSTGIFLAKIKFSEKENSIGTTLKVSMGDTVTAEYVDKTLPDPYSIDDDLSMTATAFIGERIPSIQKIVCDFPRLFDSYGNQLASSGINQKIIISSTFFSTQATDQKFVHVIQITDSNKNIIEQFFKSGVISPKEHKSLTTEWKPEKSGLFTLTVYVWESLENPVALCTPIESEYEISGDTITESKNILNSNIFSQKFDVSIPLGTNVPGCEDEHKCYIPSELHIKPNQIVVWKNNDFSPHTITSGNPTTGKNYKFDSGEITPGTSFGYHFNEKGRYPYFCTLHPWQIGIIIVD
ncbi:MAG: hypothetical protein DWQ18_04665 [Crenarchaeota archaeon]|nr:MAG: hypothetical protein DWQ17_08465 [Thermoproteota archaeon]RDJ34192.1 MAG: hypothetical protein DWQ18_04665 [Thermoproteota archaeon]RDJ37774.1 MAG: hypothetical protein DWQ19_04890 [Thermoproteota archaeon]